MYCLLRQFLRIHGANAVRKAGSVLFAVNVSFLTRSLSEPTVSPSFLRILIRPDFFHVQLLIFCHFLFSVHLPSTDHNLSTDDGGH